MGHPAAPTMSNRMLRYPSYSSSNSASSPRRTLSFFNKIRHGSRDDQEDKVYEPRESDKIVNSLFYLPISETTTRGSNGSMPSPDPFVFSSHDKEYRILVEYTRRIRKVAQDQKKMDSAWEQYKKIRDECYQLCKSLLNKSHGSRQASLEWEIGPFDTRLSHSGSSSTGSTIPQKVDETWLSAIHSYKAAQQMMHDALGNHISAVFKEYRPDSTEDQAKEFLANKELRKSVIAGWRQVSIHRTLSEKHLFWELFRIRSLNFHTLTQDIQAIEQLFESVDSGNPGSIGVREYVIVKDGDTILEFANGASEMHPILRFRVSSHFLAASSSLFAHIFSPQQGADAELDMVDDLPPPPTKHTCEDKMEVKVYRMPQFEANDNEALTILLDAAHMHKHAVPKDIDFPTFISIAEVCLRYRCLPVQIEFQVEYLWLRQWLEMAADGSPGRDGLLLITYVFGERELFKRLTKSVILNAVDDAEIQSKTLWPQLIRDKMKAIRSAKMEQISACGTNAISEYFRPPQDNTNRSAGVGSLAITTVPRCPRGSHLCDATNLGWLMLVYNEMRILPSIMNRTSFTDLPESPPRSLKEQLDCLRLMPSAPDVHSGVCDYAPAFRSAINDIYNSILGLDLDEIGSVLLPQKSAEAPKDSVSDSLKEPFELAPTAPTTPRPVVKTPISSYEHICLRILTHLDNIDDLNSAALIDKGFHHVYKRNEATLLRNAMRGERRRMSTISPRPIHEHIQSYGTLREKPLVEEVGEPKSLVIDTLLARRQNEVPPKEKQWGEEQHDVENRSDAHQNEQHNQDKRHEEQQDEELEGEELQDDDYDDMYGASPVRSPGTPDEPLMSHEDAMRFLYPDVPTSSSSRRGLHQNGVDDPNEKYLLGDVSHIEDKARMGEGYKHLRDEKDKTLGLGAYKSKPS